MKIVAGHVSGSPVLILPEGYVYLSGEWGTVGKFIRRSDHALKNNAAYTKPLTDAEEAIAMKAILLHG